MLPLWGWVLVGISVLLVTGIPVTVVLKRRRRERERIRAIRDFDQHRSQLAEEFLAAAAATGKPRGLRWKKSELHPSKHFALDRVSRELYALVGVTISFEAIEGGGMEDVEAVGNLRAATAVFVHRNGQWSTDGRAVFNLSPEETIQRYAESLEPLNDAGDQP